MRVSSLLDRVQPLTSPFIQVLRERQMEVAVGLYAAIAFAYACSSTDTQVWASMLVPFLALAAITTASRTVRFGAVLGIALVMGAIVLANIFTIANHGYFLTWVGLGLAFAVACEPPRDVIVLRRNAAMLLGILMAFALVQKLRADYYVDGDMLGDLIVQGDIFRNLIGHVLPGWDGMLADYAATAEDLMASPVASSAAVVVPATIVALAWRMTMASLAAQAVLEVLILFRERVGMLLHLMILGFVALVYLTRNENEFLSINCLLGYSMTDERTKAIRPWYVLAAIYLLSAALIDLRPSVIS
jgi:hypothetical protein